MNNEDHLPKHQTICELIETHVAPFLDSLKASGYARHTLYTKHAALRKFVSWWRRRKRPRSGPNEAEVAEFMEGALKLAKGHRCLASTALAGFLEHLRHHEVIPRCIPRTHDTTSSRLERSYTDYLRQEKGLAELTVLTYLQVVPALLSFIKERLGTTAVRRMDASLIRAFLLERAQNRSSEFVRLLSISLRSFLRFLHLRGLIQRDLTVAIPSVRKWSQADVPKKLTPEEVKRVIDTPDRKTEKGRRDYAILLLLAKLGLRSSEVISLKLEDIRWRRGEIVIRGKGSRLDVLPLPRDVGAAIVQYLRLDRGARQTEQVFLRKNAPRVPFTGPASIGHIVREHMALAGVERPKHIAAHLFRHTLASRMLQQGANLREISEVLRHRSLTSTEIYAKINMIALNEVVRPWPAHGGTR